MKHSSIVSTLRRGTLALVLVLSAAAANAEALTEFRDPLRGVSFYSAQLGSAPLTTLQTAGGRFTKVDKMTVGLSALIFDEESTVNEYILWLRHDGPRQWFIGAVEQPLTIQLHDRRLTPVPLHIARGGNGANLKPYVEKLEFALAPELVDILLTEPSVVLRLDTVMGQLEKPLDLEMINTLRQLTERVSNHWSG